MCKKCFAEVERFIVLSGKLTELENTISSKSRESFGHCGSQEYERGQNVKANMVHARLLQRESTLDADPVVVSLTNTNQF